LHFTQIFLTDALTFINLADLSYYPGSRRVVLRELDVYPVARQQPDPISFSRSGSVRQNLLLVC
jgi:hypothetical protein